MTGWTKNDESQYDTCCKCVIQGDIKWCDDSICSTHHSWYVGELRKRIAELEEKLMDYAAVVADKTETIAAQRATLKNYRDEIGRLEGELAKIWSEEKDRVVS